MVPSLVAAGVLTSHLSLLIAASRPRTATTSRRRRRRPTLYGVQGFGPAGAPSARPMSRSSAAHRRPRATAAAAPSGRRSGAYDGYRELGTLGGAESIALGVYYGTVVGQAQTAPVNSMPSAPTSAYRGTRPARRSRHARRLVERRVRHRLRPMSVGSAQVTGEHALAGVHLDERGDERAAGRRRRATAARTTSLFDQMVGHACASGNASCVGFWIKEGVSTLPTLGGQHAANAINDWEQIVGVSVAALRRAGTPSSTPMGRWSTCRRWAGRTAKRSTSTTPAT